MRQTIVVRRSSRLGGGLSLPGDKSISHRALILAALGEGRREIRNIAPGEDVQATIRCLRDLGVAIEVEGDRAVVHGAGRLAPPLRILDCGNSGTTMRLLAGVIAGMGIAATLDGDAGLRQRPMGRVLRPLREMGARCSGHAGKDGEERAPLRFEARGSEALRGAAHRLATPSAQVKSAILLAGLFAEGTTTVEEPERSRDHTERMLAAYSNGGELPIDLPPTLRIPGDASTAAFFGAAAVLVPGGEVTLRDVCLNPTRIGWVHALRRMGASIEARDERLEGGEEVGTLVARHGAGLEGIEIGGEEIPLLVDEVPILAVAATQAEGATRIRGARELRVKESDRLAAMALWLTRMGASIEEEDDGLTIYGPTPLVGTAVGASSDHRVAMSLGVAGLVAEGETSIEGGGWASVSYPDFFQVLEGLAGD